jgi:hypothetical protein
MSSRRRFATAGVVNATAAVRKALKRRRTSRSAQLAWLKKSRFTSLSRWKADKRRVETKKDGGFFATVRVSNNTWI